MKTPNLICKNCSQNPVHVFKDCLIMLCTCSCVNQLRITGPLKCTCGYMDSVHHPKVGRPFNYFSEDCLCLKPSDHLPEYIRSVPKKIRKRGK